jgi:hypothetical protein
MVEAKNISECKFLSDQTFIVWEIYILYINGQCLLYFFLNLNDTCYCENLHYHGDHKKWR